MRNPDDEIRRLNTRIVYIAGFLMYLAENDALTTEEVKKTCSLLVKQMTGWEVREGA